MENEKVSVIMGIYNCADTLPAAIESIIKQTYTDWQLIMCDDGSEDNTYEIAQSYQQRYPDRIVLTKNEKNSRLAYTLNHCLQYADGKYVARMDGDDESYPERFAKQVAYLREHPDMDLVGTAIQFFDDDGLTSITRSPEHPDRFTLRHEMPFKHASIMTYKYVFDKLGGYTVSERTMRSQDRDLFFRFYREGFSGANLLEPLYLGRDGMDAIRRRTFRVRWNSFLITRDGYKMLDYPKTWIVKPFISTICKALVPYKLIYLIRKKR